MSKGTSTGSWSTGNRSTGNGSTGSWSTGNGSTGYRSTGHFSTGNRSTGHYSSSDFSTGHFSTETPRPSFFDVEVDMSWDEASALVPVIDLRLTEWVKTEDMTEAECEANPSHVTTGGYLKVRPYHEAWAIAWAEASPETRQQFFDLPHFDAEKFLAITGIDVLAPAIEYITIGDRRYPLAEVEAALSGIKSEEAE